ncbi:MAG: hypothetical protein WBD37_00820, partial [Anderseniella sp.]
DEAGCNSYAKQMVSNSKINITRSCGIKDPRMHQNYQAHFDWCFNGRTKQQVRSTLKEVINSIEQCAVKKSRVKLFKKPSNFRGTPLDGCIDSDVRGCGKGAADYFCEKRGYKKSKRHNTGGAGFTVYHWCLDYNAAQTQQWIDKGGTCFCSDDNKQCSYFKEIECEGTK